MGFYQSGRGWESYRGARHRVALLLTNDFRIIDCQLEAVGVLLSRLRFVGCCGRCRFRCCYEREARSKAAMLKDIGLQLLHARVRPFRQRCASVVSAIAVLCSVLKAKISFASVRLKPYIQRRQRTFVLFEIGSGPPESSLPLR